MNSKLRNLQVVGAVVTMMLAALWHFVYAWIHSGVLAVIFPFNESLWEHFKLFFFSAIIYYVIVYFAAGKKYPNFIFSHGLSIVIMTALALELFYGSQLAAYSRKPHARHHYHLRLHLHRLVNCV